MEEEKQEGVAVSKPEDQGAENAGAEAGEGEADRATPQEQHGTPKMPAREAGEGGQDDGGAAE